MVQVHSLCCRSVDHSGFASLIPTRAAPVRARPTAEPRSPRQVSKDDWRAELAALRAEQEAAAAEAAARDGRLRALDDAVFAFIRKWEPHLTNR